jgi:TM2 domain-containing membrane protein YozV
MHQVDREFSPGVAMVLSFVWPGLGQIYRGNLGSGLLWMITIPVGYLCLIVPGVILHIVCVAMAGHKA